MSRSSSGLEYSKVAEIRGPLLVIDGVERAAFEELVEIEDSEGKRRLARVLETGFGKAVVQVFEGTSGLSISGTKARFLGRTMELPVSDQILGRVLEPWSGRAGSCVSEDLVPLIGADVPSNTCNRVEDPPQFFPLHPPSTSIQQPGKAPLMTSSGPLISPPPCCTRVQSNL